METLDVIRTQWTQAREYDQKIEQRAEKHKGLRGRNNVTSCRSPTRELDTRWIKTELKRKRQQEFHRRRSMSPERAKDHARDDSCVVCNTAKSETPWAKVTTTPKSETPWVKVTTTPKSETPWAKVTTTPKSETPWVKVTTTPKSETPWAKVTTTPKLETPRGKVTTTSKTGRARNTAKIKDDSCVMCDDAMTESLRGRGSVSWPLTPRPTANGHLLIMSRRMRVTKDDLAELENSEWASIWTDQTPIRKNTKNSARKLESVFSTLTTSTLAKSSTSTLNRGPHTSTTTTSILNPLTTASTPNRGPRTSAPSPNRTGTPISTSIKEVQPRLKTSTNTEKGILKGAGESNRCKKTLTEASAQTEPGFVTVKESEVLLLADYLQEALWREEGLKRKLAVIQRSSSTLLLHTDQLWTTRCNEDLLKTKIKALDSQLQVCLKKQKLPQDGVKKLTLQMEEQKGAYEGKALEAIQRATEEKNKALTQAETVEMLLQAAREEAAWWQSKYEQMKERSEQLENIKRASADQLLQLHNQLELVWGQEAWLREELQAMRRVEEELRYNVAMLEEQNQSLTQEVQKTKDASAVVQDFWGQPSAHSAMLPENSELEQNLAQFDCMLEEQKEEPEVDHVEEKEEKMEEVVDNEEEEMEQEEEREGQSGDGDHVVEQLRHTQERLQLKERECEELQGELEIMEAECQSCQVRLTQCREELRLLNQRHGSKKPSVSWLWLCVFLLLLLSVVTVAILWAWHPSFGDQVQYLYTAVVELIEDYLQQATSVQHSACFRPI